MSANPAAPMTSSAMPMVSTLPRLPAEKTLSAVAAACPRISEPSVPATVLRPPALDTSPAAFSIPLRSPLSSAALSPPALAASSFLPLARASFATSSSAARQPGVEPAICASAVQRKVELATPRSNHFQLNAARTTAMTKKPR